MTWNRNSLVNRFYFETTFSGIRNLRLINRTKFEVNKQLAGRLDNGMYQRGDRITSITLVNKADYTWRIGRKWEIIAQAKLQLLKRTRKSELFPIQHERIFVPILKAAYWLTPRTVIRGAAEGLPGLAYSFTDLANDRETFEQRTYTIFFTNLSEYFGYQISASTGLTFDWMDFQDPFRRTDETDSSMLFFQVIVGY